jgi:hypothetical protein
MIDLKRYHRLLPLAGCWVERNGNQIKVLTKRFDNETGAELSPEYQYVTVADLKQEKIELENKLEALNSILNDIE